jgi:hypothetical protein
LTISKEEGQTTQWSKEEGQTTQWSKEKEQTTQWSKEKIFTLPRVHDMQKLYHPHES